MKKFKHTRRSGFAFTLFGPFTLFILNWVMLAHARSEVNSITKDKEGYKKSMPFICAILLGLLTLGIVPLVWLGNLAGKIKRLSQEYGVEKKARGGAFVICWLLFGSLILVGPFVAFMGFFRSLNRLEKKLNELAEAGEGEPKEELELKEEPKEEGEPMEELELKEEPKEELEEPKEEPKEEAKEEKKPEPKPEPKPAKKSEVVAVPPVEKRKFRVRVGKDQYRYFETKEEAVAFAKGLAESRGVNVIVK